MKPAGCGKRWRATTPSGANSTPKIFPISTTPICALYSEMASRTGNPPRKVMRSNRAALVGSIVRWTGQHKYTVDMLVRKLIERCQELKLTIPPPLDRARVSFELAAYLSAHGHQSSAHGPFQEVGLIVKVLVLVRCCLSRRGGRTFSPQALKEEEDKPTEADVLACLQRLGHEVETLAVFDDVVCIVEKLKSFRAGSGFQSHRIVPFQPRARAEYPRAAGADAREIHRRASGRPDALQGQSARQEGAGLSSRARAAFRHLHRASPAEALAALCVSRPS